MIDGGLVIDLTIPGRRRTDPKLPVVEPEQEDTSGLRALLIELLEHEDRGYGAWTTGMRRRVIEGIAPGAIEVHQLDRRWA